jgi:hypothetical protein
LPNPEDTTTLHQRCRSDSRPDRQGWSAGRNGREFDRNNLDLIEEATVAKEWRGPKALVPAEAGPEIAESGQRVSLAVRLPPDVHRHLQLLGVHERKKLQALLMEGIARVFMARGDMTAMEACRRAGVNV